ncbi:tyrosine-type recombinase/integrase [Streptomyces collinus]|uniref:tyrosine-type recombinase/integrase n=1 Tax=Streptomyces collinus TaxID=42684 RepID=UPI0036760FB3
METVADYVVNVRPRFGCEGHPALCVTERGGRVKPAEINARFVAYRNALKLPKALTLHSARHAYVTHLTEDGVDRRFLQQQVCHENNSFTAIYTQVSDDFMNSMLHKALAPALAPASADKDR